MNSIDINTMWLELFHKKLHLVIEYSQKFSQLKFST